MNIKDNELKQMVDFSNWRKVANGLYCFAISPNICYEIHINIYKKSEHILKANASLFMAGDCYDKNDIKFFYRKCLLKKQNVTECIKKAIQHYKKEIKIECGDKI